MAKKFTEKQREVIARRLGYKGPMSEFYKFVQSDPAMESKVRQLAVKLVAKGGYIQKFAVGGTATDQVENLYQSILGRESDPGGKAHYEEKIAAGASLADIQKEIAASPEAQARAASTTTTPTTTTTTPTTTTTTPTVPKTTNVTAEKVPTATGQSVNTAAAAASAAAAAAAQVEAAKIAAAAEATAREAEKIKAEKTQAAVKAEVDALQPAKGTLSAGSKVDPITMNPADTAIKKLEAEQGIATQVTGAPVREVQSGELVESTAVDRAAVEAALAKNKAEQGVITEEMTVEGQLAKLLTNFEANNPPVWAASSMRNATAVLAQRGLGASSLAGQAVIQATLEAAIPIASADAAAYREMGLANLSNRQQMALLTAQQRAAFLGQEFDQEFQRRAINAAKISDIANINFSAKQQIALENARLTETMNLANLSNRQALIMAEAAQIATLEVANLNNRQQAAVFNAQAFLQMDMANLSNAQQTALFKSQAIIQSIMGDAAAENAARQFNAESINQINTFYDGLNARIREFNTAQMNSMNQFNVNQVNSIEMFNKSAQNNRDQFNADFRRVIDQSNAEWRRTIALADTAATNRANEINAASALSLTTIEYNNLWQKYRDEIEYAWKTGENSLDRENELARQILAKNATIEAAKYGLKAEAYKALGALGTTIFDKAGGADVVASLLKGGATAIKDAITSTTSTYQFLEVPGSSGWKFWTDGTNTISLSPDNVTYWNDTPFDDSLGYAKDTLESFGGTGG